MTVEQATPKKRHRGRLFVLALIGFIVVVVIVTSGHSGPSAKLTHKVDSVYVLDPQHVRVYITWGNDGRAAGTETCTLSVTAYSPFGDQIGSGFDTTSPNAPVQPGATENQYQDIIVTGNNASGVTSKKDVSITGC